MSGKITLIRRQLEITIIITILCMNNSQHYLYLKKLIYIKSFFQLQLRFIFIRLFLALFVRRHRRRRRRNSQCFEMCFFYY